MDFHSEDLQSVLAEVDTNVETGLSKDEVKARIEKFGQNKLKEKKRNLLWQGFLSSLKMSWLWF